MNNFYKDAKEFAIANIEPYAKEQIIMENSLK